MTSQKIYSFIQSHGFEIQKIIKTPTQIYIELLSQKADPILLKVSESQIYPPYPYPVVLYTDTGDFGSKNELEDYIHQSETFVENIYSEPENIMEMPVRHRTIPMSQHLTETYNKKVTVDDSYGDEYLVRHSISRQLKRLRYCIKGMTHKLAIIYDPYIGILNDEDVEMFQIDKVIDKKKKHKMYLVVNFRVFYDRLRLIEMDCTQILTGIYEILKSTQKQHTCNISKMIDRKNIIVQQMDSLRQKKIDYEKYINQYTDLLDELYTYEFQKQSELQNFNTIQTDTIHTDMKRNNQIRKLEKELNELSQTKKKIMETVSEMKMKYEQLLLVTDTVLFDNIVILDQIFKNFEKLEILQTI